MIIDLKSLESVKKCKSIYNVYIWKFKIWIDRIVTVPWVCCSGGISLGQDPDLCPKDVIFFTTFFQFIVVGSCSTLLGVGILNKDSRISWGSTDPEFPTVDDEECSEFPAGTFNEFLKQSK